MGGDFVVVWGSAEADGSGLGGFGVVGQRFDGAGNPLGTEFHVNTYTIGPQWHPVVGANGTGTFVVVWENGPYGCGPPCKPPAGVTVTGQRYAASGAPQGPEFAVDGASYEHDLAVAVAPSGAFMVVWSRVAGQAPPPPADVFARIYDNAGIPLGPAFRVNAYTQYDQTGGSVAVDPAGNFVVVWSSQYSANNWDVIGQRYAASGQALGPQFRANTYTPGFQADTAVAADPSGNFVVAWSSDSSGNPPEPGLFGQRFASSGAPLGSEFRINTYAPGEHDGPAMTADDGGNFVIVWTDSPYFDGGDVFGQRYSSLGVPAGPEFRVNTSTAFVQRNASVASTPSGIFLVTWDSGTSQFGDVYAQRFGGIFPVELQDFRLE
jgi:hypothetical protein